jgi:hypothetical protein
MKSFILILLAAMLLVGCAKPPELVYHHPRTGTKELAIHIEECGRLADRFGYVNMTPVHQYAMPDMKDGFQRDKVFDYCMAKKGYEQGDSGPVVIDDNNTRIYIADSSLSSGETTQVTIVFPLAVGGLDAEDLQVENGTLSNIHTPDRGLTWIMTLTPTANLEAPRNVIALNNAGVTSIYTNPGIGTTYSGHYRIDTLRPTVAINIHDKSLHEGLSRSVVTFTFSEAPADFTLEDIQVTNGKVSSLVRDDATHYHAIFIADSDFKGSGSIRVNAAKFTDLANNSNQASPPDFVSIDTLKPALAAYRP